MVVLCDRRSRGGDDDGSNKARDAVSENGGSGDNEGDNNGRKGGVL